MFRSKRADRIKFLVWDGSGLVLVWEQLSQAAFRWPPVVDGVMRLSALEFAALFDGLDTYAPRRQHQHARALLGDYRGILQCDGYAAYKSLIDPSARRGPSKLAFCWSHARRNFYDLAKGGAAPIATEALQKIARLYQIEADIRGLSAPERRSARQARSRPLLEELRSWFALQRVKLPGSAPTAEAIGYTLNHWDGLVQFVDDGRIEIDSNCVERSMRPVALSRKNSLFAGSDEGAENWAAVASLIETCWCGRSPYGIAVPG